MLDLTHTATTVLASFMASLVEFVEALTIVLAVGTVRGWRPALLGAGAGCVLLLLLVAAFGPLLANVPIAWMQLLVGTLLLLFGMRWLRKAVLRSAGLVALHDETAIYAEESRALRDTGAGPGYWDTVAVVTAFKAVVLEGLEVVFIVIALGATGELLAPASLGAGAALLLVLVVGVVVHRPLARVPENALKFAVGVMLAAFGVFWVGEGVGFPWPGGDLAILGLIVGFFLTALVSVRLARSVRTRAISVSA